jgi:nucleotide-binding universal stress UspA family protein
MLKPKKILLASHGTKGARAADRLALSLCGPQTVLFHLVVVPDFWKGMMGDDWLNNAATRDVFGKYVETQLEGEVRKHIDKVRKQAIKRKTQYKPEIVLGKPAEHLLERVRRGGVDLVVTGAPRPKGVAGLRSRMLTDQLMKSLKIPLLIAPFPHG